MKTGLKLLLFLVPAVAATLYVLWKFSPEQTVIRRAEALFTCLEKSTLSTGTPSEKAERFQTVLSPALEIRAPHPVESGAIGPAQAGRMLKDFQQSITSCKISCEEESVDFPAEDHAVYQVAIFAEIAQGPGRKYHMRYHCRIEFKRSGRDWLAEAITLTPI